MGDFRKLLETGSKEKKKKNSRGLSKQFVLWVPEDEATRGLRAREHLAVLQYLLTKEGGAGHSPTSARLRSFANKF